MPELPDVDVYVERLAARCVGRPLTALRVANPFVLRTVQPPPTALVGRRVETVRRVGKRVALRFEGDLWAVIHLMVAGRLKRRPPGAAIPKGAGLLAFDFPDDTFLLTEAGTKRRARLDLVEGDAVTALDPGGLEVLDATPEAFAAALRRENRTVKRALTDPRILSGIGNAYSDEILWAAHLSPARLTQRMDDAELAALHRAATATLTDYRDRLRREVGGGFPETVTAFRADFAVHGRYRQPCPRCGAEVQRIRYADNEANYCARCQNADRLLADRGLSRLLKQDWPRTLAELEERRG